MLFVVSVKLSHYGGDCLKIVEDFLNNVFRCWLNGCVDGLCEFGVFTRDYSFLDIGLSFLSVLSFYSGIRRVYVHDVLGLKKYAVGFNGFSSYDLSLDALGVDFSEKTILGYMVVTRSHIMEPFIYDLGRITVPLQKIIMDMYANLKHDIDVAMPSCEPCMFSMRKHSKGYRYYVFYMCSDRDEYEKLYRLIWLIKCFSNPLFKQEAVVKPVWRQLYAISGEV